MSIMVDGEMVLYGFVGDNFWGDGFTAREVIDALAEHGRDVDLTVRLNSGGGYVDDGIAIFNALSNHKGKVTVIIDSVAASSASVIALAGAERIMRKGAMIMIHDPSSIVWGTAEDMEKATRMLEKHAENIAGIYADVTGEDVEDLRADMKAETWMTAEEAVDRGFATSANEKKAKAAAAHDYSVYAHAPDRLVALASKKHWSRDGLSGPTANGARARNSTEEDIQMADKVDADKVAADLENAKTEAAKTAATATKDRIKAIMTSDEAKGREALAQHFAYETEMSADAAITALKVAPKASAEGSGGDPSETYEKGRTNTTGLSQPGGGQNGDKPNNDNKVALGASLARANKRR